MTLQEQINDFERRLSEVERTLIMFRPIGPPPNDKIPDMTDEQREKLREIVRKATTIR